jgi:hypothetical protein
MPGDPGQSMPQRTIAPLPIQRRIAIEKGGRGNNLLQVRAIFVMSRIAVKTLLLGLPDSHIVMACEDVACSFGGL